MSTTWYVLCESFFPPISWCSVTIIGVERGSWHSATFGHYLLSMLSFLDNSLLSSFAKDRPAYDSDDADEKFIYGKKSGRGLFVWPILPLPRIKPLKGVLWLTSVVFAALQLHIIKIISPANHVFKQCDSYLPAHNLFLFQATISSSLNFLSTNPPTIPPACKV